MSIQHSSTIFKENWSVYQKLIANNYMLHREFGSQMGEMLENFRHKPEFAILDLGCGDSRLMVEQLHSFDNFSYKGFDMSEAALEVAKENASVLQGHVSFVNGPMETLIDYETKQFDVIFSSYAIHHLNEEKKQALLMSCAEKLKDDGMLVIADVFRQENQSRESYLEEYLDAVNNKWNALSQAERDLIVNHITLFDFPSEIKTFEQYLSQNGFKIDSRIDTDVWHKMLVIKKAF